MFDNPARLTMHSQVVARTLCTCPCHVGAPGSLSRGFYHPYQIGFTLFDIIIEFTKVNGVDLYTFGGINPNFRVGQPPIFVRIKVVLFMRFEQKYIMDKTLSTLIVQHCIARQVGLAKSLPPLFTYY